MTRERKKNKQQQEDEMEYELPFYFTHGNTQRHNCKSLVHLEINLKISRNSLWIYESFFIRNFISQINIFFNKQNF